MSQQEVHSPPEKPKQRLSTPQMLHLMRLEMERALRHEYAISCLVIGLDGFNGDGDLALRKLIMPGVFHQLKAVTFHNDVRGLGIWTERYLLAVFPHVTPEKITSLAAEILARAAHVELPEVCEADEITLSVGISHNLHPGPMSFEILVEEAEAGMGLAQSAGGDRYIQAKDVETEVDRLKDELATQLEELEENQDSYFGDLDGFEQNWGKNLLEQTIQLFEREPDQSAGVIRLQKEVIALIKGEIEAWRQQSGVTSMVESQRQIAKLERRVRKLSDSLGVTEEELQRVAAMKSIDLGVSSIYRTVQGLASEDAQAEAKGEMLKNIFEANLALQREAS